MSQDNYIPESFKIGRQKKIEKKWGEEILIINNKDKNYCGKILNIKAGGQMSLHFHTKKDEIFYVINGNVELIIIFNGEEKRFILNPTNSFHIFSGLIHKLIGITNAQIAEFSTFDNSWDSFRITKSIAPNENK